MSQEKSISEILTALAYVGVSIFGGAAVKPDSPWRRFSIFAAFGCLAYLLHHKLEQHPLFLALFMLAWVSVAVFIPGISDKRRQAQITLRWNTGEELPDGKIIKVTLEPKQALNLVPGVHNNLANTTLKNVRLALSFQEGAGEKDFLTAICWQPVLTQNSKTTWECIIKEPIPHAATQPVPDPFTFKFDHAGPHRIDYVIRGEEINEIKRHFILNLSYA